MFAQKQLNNQNSESFVIELSHILRRFERNPIFLTIYKTSTFTFIKYLSFQYSFAKITISLKKNYAFWNPKKHRNLYKHILSCRLLDLASLNKYGFCNPSFLPGLLKLQDVAFLLSFTTYCGTIQNNFCKRRRKGFTSTYPLIRFLQ